MKKRYLLAMGALVMGLACTGCSGNSGQLDGGIIRIAYNQAPTHPITRLWNAQVRSLRRPPGEI